MTDDEIYRDRQDEAAAAYEARCLRCGACCGAENDPCANLIKDAAGRFYCAVYEDRLGVRKTVSGKDFTCVPIRDLLKYSLPSEQCGYGKDVP